LPASAAAAAAIMGEINAKITTSSDENNPPNDTGRVLPHTSPMASGDIPHASAAAGSLARRHRILFHPQLEMADGAAVNVGALTMSVQ